MEGQSRNHIKRQDFIDEILEECSEISQIDKGDISKKEVTVQLAGAEEKLLDDSWMDIFDNQNLVKKVLADIKTGTAPEQQRDKEKDAKVKITIAQDKMSARIRIAPPAEGGKGITEDDILEQLREKRIIKGIKFEYIYRLANHTVYNKTFKIAQGEEKIDGTDAQLKCHFETEQEATAFYSKEDYARIQYQKVKAGDLLCEILPPTYGRSGWNILGQTLPGKDGDGIGDISGMNTVLTGTLLYATCDGLVSLQNGKVNVFSAKTIVMLENARLEYDGTVFVDGNVTNGSRIKASGDIIIKGSVQNAILEAGGNITLCKGITGKNSHIKAGGNIRSYFIEKAEVYAGKNIVADVVMLASIRCAGTLTLSGRRAALIGGSCQVGKDLNAKNIGNDANVLTEVALIGQKRLQKEKDAALTRIEECRAAIDQLLRAMKTAVNKAKSKEEIKTLAIRITYAKKKLEQEIDDQNKVIEEINAKEGLSPSGKITVSGKLYPNVVLNIDEVHYTNTQEKNYCVIAKNRSELDFSSI